MFERIKEIIEEQLGIHESDRISFETLLRDDLDADSLDAAEIIMSIEDEFDVEIPDSVAERFESVGDIVSYVEKHI